MNEARAAAILKFLGAAFLLLFCLAPCLWMLIVSVGKNPDFLAPQIAFVLTLTNYADLLTAETVHLTAYLVNSVVVSAAAALLATIFGTLSAYAVTRLRFPGRIAVPVLVLAFSMFPQISIVGYLFKLMTRLGWINTYHALILPYLTLGLPLALWIMLSYFKQLSPELDRAALIDGATRLQVLRKIIVPIALPGAVSTLMLVFIFSFNEFLFALMLTTDHGARTIPVGIALFEGLHGEIPYGHIMAAAVIATIPMIILAAVFQRRIISGLTQGAVKG